MLRHYKLDMNWELLADQKQFLLELIQADIDFKGLTRYGEYATGDHPLDGILATLDSIQDQAADQGECVVFKPSSWEDE